MTTSKIALDVLSDFKLEVAPKQTKSRVERVLTERYKLNDLEEIKKKLRLTYSHHVQQVGRCSLYVFSCILQMSQNTFSSAVSTQ